MLMRFRPTLVIFLCAVALISIGLVMVYSASAARIGEPVLRRTLAMVDHPERDVLLSQASVHSINFATRQFYWAIVAVLGMFVAFQAGPQSLRPIVWPIFGIAVIGLLLCYVPGVGKEVNGAHRWIGVGGFRIQPSEIAKLAVILLGAHYLSKNLDRIGRFWTVIFPAYAVVGVVCVLIKENPDLGAAGMVFVTFFLMLLVAGARPFHLLVCLLPAFVGLYLELHEPFRRQRLMAFWDADSAPAKDVWQLNQSLTAVSTGGLHGLGLGNGPQKYNFLSEAHTDFIYAVIAEETGFIGAAVVLAIYMVLTLTAIEVGRRVRGSFEGLVVTGIITIIGLQAFINMFVVLGMLPTKGLTLPLVSYGGSSLVISCFAVGLLMHVAKTTELQSQPSSRALPLAA